MEFGFDPHTLNQWRHDYFIELSLHFKIVLMAQTLLDWCKMNSQTFDGCDSFALKKFEPGGSGRFSVVQGGYTWRGRCYRCYLLDQKLGGSSAGNEWAGTELQVQHPLFCIHFSAAICTVHIVHCDPSFQFPCEALKIELCSSCTHWMHVLFFFTISQEEYNVLVLQTKPPSQKYFVRWKQIVFHR